MSNKLWQRSMITLARSQRLSNLIQNNPLLHTLSRRFVGGRDQGEVLSRAQDLDANHLDTSVYYLGEYVTDPVQIEANLSEIEQVIETFGKAGAEIHMSVDPTQIGYAVSEEVGYSNALRIGQLLAKHPTAKFLMIDMEDYSYLERSLNLFYRLRDAGLKVAVTLQAYLYRTANDIDHIIQKPAAIRLVKGAFAESDEVAWTKKEDIDNSFIQLSEKLLQPEMREQGIYPIFATHDHNMIERIKELLNKYQWQADEYEFEMLLGVREPLQRELAAGGYPVRLYVPFGTDWWAYTARRIGENPANLRFVMRALSG